MATLVLIRHGESQWNLENRFTGWVDVPLSPKGILEAHAAGEKLKKENISYRTDSTNTDDRYLRNHLRLNVISEFERINPEYRKNLDSFMGYMGELRDFIDAQVEVFLRGESSFLVEDFQILSAFLQREVVRYLYEKANSGTIGLSEGGIAELIRFMGDKGNYTKKNGKVYFITHAL